MRKQPAATNSTVGSSNSKALPPSAALSSSIPTLPAISKRGGASSSSAPASASIMPTPVKNSVLHGSSGSNSSNINKSSNSSNPAKSGNTASAPPPATTNSNSVARSSSNKNIGAGSRATGGAAAAAAAGAGAGVSSQPQQKDELYETYHEKVSAADVRNEIDEFEHRLAHGAVYSAAPRRQSVPSSIAGAAGKRVSQQQQQQHKPSQLQSQQQQNKGTTAPLKQPLDAGAETEDGEVDHRAQKRNDVAMVRGLPKYSEGSDSD